MIEILSPAGDRESFVAAIHNGANAVYLGLNRYNARENAASNFSIDDLDALVPYAHVFGVRVYLTVNTLIKEEETNEVLKMIFDASNLGVDAFIVQDIGLASLIHKIFPSVELHASTQMGIHNVPGALVAQKIGISRIVLSRETTLEEIAKIKKETTLELEFFVQGALCVAFSGNCHLSHCLTGKSANRGQCAQPCRHWYRAIKNGQILGEGHLLSAKDISMVNRLKDLADAGITSFKIEGRARRASYVAESTRIYSEIVNNNFVSNESQTYALKQSFNRGDFCEAYLDTKDVRVDGKSVIYPLVSGNIGVSVGKVLNFTAGNKFNVVRVSSILPLNKGDGLKFLRNGRDVGSVGVYDIQQTRENEYSFTTTSVAQTNDEVRLISQASREDKILSRRKKLIALGQFEARIGKKPKFTIEFENHRVTAEGDEIVEKALTQATSEEQIRSQLMKTGSEVFEFASVKIDIDDVFLRIAKINSLRRDALIALTKLIADDYKSLNGKSLGAYALNVGESINYHTKDKDKNDRMAIVCLSSEQQLSDELVEHSNYIAFNPPIFSVECVRSFASRLKTYDESKRTFLFLPTFASSSDIALINKIIDEVAGLGLVANNIYGLNYILSGCPVIAGPHMNIFNTHTINFLDQFGIECSIVSPELSESEYKKLNDLAVKECFYFAFGKETLMTLCHCPIQLLTGCTCLTCQYAGAYQLQHEDDEILTVDRTKLSWCTFNVSRLKKIPNAMFLSTTNLFFDFSGIEVPLVDAVVKKLLVPIKSIETSV